MQQQPPGWGPPQGYGPPGYPPQGYPPPGYPPPTPPRKKTPVALIAVGALVGICGVCTIVGALVPKPPAGTGVIWGESSHFVGMKTNSYHLTANV